MREATQQLPIAYRGRRTSRGAIVEAQPSTATCPLGELSDGAEVVTDWPATYGHTWAERFWAFRAAEGYRYVRGAMRLGNYSIPVPPGERRAALKASAFAEGAVPTPVPADPATALGQRHRRE